MLLAARICNSGRGNRIGEVMRRNVARSDDAPGSLLYLRVKIFKQWIIEKFTNADFQAITNVPGGDAHIAISLSSVRPSYPNTARLQWHVLPAGDGDSLETSHYHPNQPLYGITQRLSNCLHMTSSQ